MTCAGWRSKVLPMPRPFSAPQRRDVSLPPTQVLGNAKGVVAVVTSVLYFQNPVNAMSALGYTITVAGVVAYSQV